MFFSQLHSDHQARLLRKRLGDAVTTPFYRQFWPDELWKQADLALQSDDWLSFWQQKVPLLDKTALQACSQQQLLSLGGLQGHVDQDSSSGTSGQPFTVLYNRGYVTNRNWRFLRALHASGYRWPMRMLLITRDRAMLVSRMRNWHYLSLKDGVETWIETFERVKPEMLYGCTTALRIIADYYAACGRSFYQPRIVMTIAETLDDLTRELLTEVFNAPVFDLYGLTEMGLVAWECKAHDGYHLAEDSVLTERLPDTDPEMQRLVFSNLHLSSQPLLRYASGDLAEGYTTERCRCGSRLPRIRRFVGRQIDMLEMPDQQELSPYHVTSNLEKVAGLRQYQVIQDQPGKLTVHYYAISDIDQPAAETAIRRVMESLWQGPLQLDICRHFATLGQSDRKFRPVENQMKRRAG